MPTGKEKRCVGIQYICLSACWYICVCTCTCVIFVHEYMQVHAVLYVQKHKLRALVISCISYTPSTDVLQQDRGVFC